MREHEISPSQGILDASSLQKVQRRPPSKKSKRKKKKILSSTEVVIEVRGDCFAELTDDPEARMEATFDIEIRFKVEPSSAGVKDKVMHMSNSYFDRYWRRASKFASTPGLAIQRMLDYFAEVRPLLDFSFSILRCFC